MDFFRQLFDTSDFTARWTCGQWSSGHGWLHILSDLGVWSAYFAIPFILGYFAFRRRDLPFRKLFLLFVAFILLCGATHFMEAVIFWWPAYRLAGVLKLFTAIVSWVTVFALIRATPKILMMRTPDELERQVDERTRELTQAMATLKSERELLRTTLASIGEGVITTDRQGYITSMNAVAESLTEWTAADAVGQPLEAVFRIVNDETRLPVENPAMKALRDGTIVGLANHTLLIGKGNTARPIDDSASPIRLDVGEIVGCVLVFRDISERHRQEAELRERERQFVTLAESIPHLAWMANPDGHIFWFNRRWYEYTGTTFEQMQGWRWQSVHDPEELPKVLVRWKASIDTAQPFDMVFPLKDKDGEFHQFLTRVEPVKDEKGDVVRWFGTNTDVTEQSRSANELRRLAAELSEADRRKDEFLATLAHELRNPLAPLRNGLQILRLSGVNGSASEQTRSMMERQLTQMVRLVDDLLDVSRIRSGKVELHKQRVEIAVVVSNAVETSRPLIESCGQELAVRLPPEPVFVDADMIRLAQVFSNLLNNAAKYSERGGRIVLTVERPGSEAVVRVRDTGVGIPPEMLPRIFEMFTQVDRTLEKSHGGLGIGLTLVKRLVEMHGGSVEAHSEGPGKGSEFVVRLPVMPAAIHELKPPAEEGQPNSSGTCRILVADDNRDSADSLAVLLTIMGNEVRTANNGLTAVESAATFRPEVILMDIGMPKLNGYEACRRIRDQAWGKTIVIVACTGWGQDEDKRKSQEAGFNFHMVKPVDPAALGKLLASMKTAKA